MLNQTNANFALYFAVAGVSLITGYYLGQILPAASKADQLKDSKEILKQGKHDATGHVYDSDEQSSTCDSEEEEEEEEEYEIESVSLNDIPGEVRMALVIRQDLGMQKGKTAAQCSHAALSCFIMIATDESRISYNPLMVQRWFKSGQPKITLKCPDKETMDELYAMAISLGVNASVIHDAGRTQVAAGSATVLGLGPAPKAVLDQITGKLKLY